jgi:transposase
MSEKAKEIMGVEKFTNLADKGYYYGEDIAACENSGVTCLVPKPRPGGAKKAEGFSHEDFIYDKEKDIYICPCKNPLCYKGHRKHISGREYRVYANYSVCQKCRSKSECTKYTHREVVRQKNQNTLDMVDERTRKDKALYHKRQEIVEHPFGTIKAVWGYKQFLCRTKPKVTAETAMAFLAYNMRRVFNISKGNGVKPAKVMA